MNLLPEHQRNRNRNLFGLLGNRFLYNKGPNEQPIGDVESAERRVERIKQEMLEQMKDSIGDYNAKYGEHMEAANKEQNGPDYYFETLDASVDDLDRLYQRLWDISINIKHHHEPKWREKMEQNPDLNEQLLAVERMIGAVRELKLIDEKGVEYVTQKRRERLTERHQEMAEAAEKKELWAKKPAYKEILGIFDSMAGNKEFEGLFGSPDGMVTQNQREARDLFMALMAEETNGFESFFPFGKDFGDNPEENIANYPFLYSEFLKHEGDALTGEGVSLETIRSAEVRYAETSRGLEGETAKDVVRNIQSVGNPDELPDGLPAIPDNEGWKERIRIIKSWEMNARERSAQAPDMPQRDTYLGVATKLRKHLDHAEAGLSLSMLRTSESVVRSKFTRTEFTTNPIRRNLAVALAMKKFMKAQELVDHPAGAKSDWRYTLHPTVRRMLVISTYDAGVGAFEEDDTGAQDFRDKPRPMHQWMLVTLAMSDYFNFKEVGDEMDEEHMAVLKAAFVGGQVAELIEHSEEVDELLTDWMAVLKANPNAQAPEEREKLFRERMGHYPPKFVEPYSKLNYDAAKERQDKVREDQKILKEFLRQVQVAVQNPYSTEGKAFIQDIKDEKYAGKISDSITRLGDWSMVSNASLQAYYHRMAHLRLNYKISELGEQNMLQYFEGLGLNIEGVYPAYLSFISKNPRLKIEHWDGLLFGTEEDYKLLMDMLNVIIPNQKSGGKKDFLDGLALLRKKYKGQTLNKIEASLQEGSEDFAIFNTFKMLQEHLRLRESKAATAHLKQAEIDDKLRGVHIGDKISEYVGGVWDMLAGPGQSPANRAAGLILMYGFYKSARMAMKGDTKMAKMFRALYVAGAIEIAMKEVTGRGILDRAGLDAISGAMEDTYKGVLLQDAEENMDNKNITPEAHGAALNELDHVPFHKVIEWYDSCDNLGNPRDPKNDKFKELGINLTPIKKKVTWTKTDKESEARQVVWETVRHFFKYVGQKDNNRSLNDGKMALQERWVTMFDDRDYDPIYSKYDTREWFASGRVKKEDITWNMVMTCEIDPSEVDLTRDKTMFGQVKVGAQEVAAEASEWVQAHVLNPSDGLADELINSAGEYGKSAKNLADEYWEATKRKVYFTKESMILWYGEHQYEIKRVATDHWNLLVTAVKTPFKIVYAVDQMMVPWTLKTITQIEEIIRSDKLVPTGNEGKDELSASDIVAPGKIPGSSNKTLNPQYEYYGVYQVPFLQAFNKKRAPNEEMYYHNTATDVGYYISGVSIKDVPKINVNKEPYKSNKDARHAELVIAAREKAEKHFRGQGMEPAQIAEYMDQIHQVVKTGEPEAVYLFFRMPLKGSMELHLKEIGRWADYQHADRKKHREDFKVDPSQSTWENLSRAFLLDSDITRTVVSQAGAYAAQLPRFVFWNLEGAGGIIKAVGTQIFGKGKEFEDAVDAVMVRPESQRMWLDEVFTSAQNPGLALSKFYQNKTNSKLYAFSLDYAKRSGGGKPLHLGLLEGEPAVDGEDVSQSMYLDGTLNYQEMMAFYNSDYAPIPGKKDDELRDKIQAKIDGANRPQRPAPGRP